jgi:hypothetical protein
MRNNFLFRLFDNVQKDVRGRQATDDNMIRRMDGAIYMLDN